MKRMEALDKYEKKYRSKRIIVTGSSGYIGRELSNLLSLAGVQVIGIDKNPSNATITEYGFNLTDIDKTRKLIQEVDPQILFHTGTNSALHYFNDFMKAFDEDYRALSNILNTVNGMKVRLVFFSSSYVYSGKYESVLEDVALSPVHNFGVGKIFFEQAITRSLANSTVFRLSSVFGSGQPRSPNALKTLKDEAEKHGSISIWGDGSRRMQYVFLDDVLSATLGSEEIPYGIYNLGGDEYMNMMDVSAMIGQILGCRVSFDRSKAAGETLPFMINSKLCQEAAFEFTSIEKSLETYLLDKKLS